MDNLSHYQAACAAIRHRRLQDLREVLIRFPMLPQSAQYAQGLLRLAAKNNDIEAFQILFDAGTNINVGENERLPEGIIDRAASDGALESVRWLLEHGALINLEVKGVIRCFALSSAIISGHIEVVRLLVEHGADINAIWAGRNALSFAIDYGRIEIAEYLRQHGATLPREFDLATTSEDSDILRHIKYYFGQPRPLSIRAVVPTEQEIVVHVVPLQDRQLLITEGMSNLPMRVPPNFERFAHAELILALPRDWPLTPEGLADPATSWPVQLIRRTAYFPHHNDEHLGAGVTVIANGDPPQPLGPGTRLSCVLALAQIGEKGQPTFTDGRKVVFYLLIPLYSEERELEQRDGIHRLLDLLDSHSVSEVLDPNRRSVVDFGFSDS